MIGENHMLDKQKIVERMRKIYELPLERAQDLVGGIFTLKEIKEEFNKLFDEIIHTKFYDASPIGEIENETQ